MHQKSDDEYEMDEFEISHARLLLESILQGIEAVKAEGVFSRPDPFLAIWISDTSENIMAESVRRLNPPNVVSEFMTDFG